MSLYASLQPADFENGTCVMWAVLALAGLDELAPPDYTTSNGIFGPPYRESLDALCSRFVCPWNALALSERNFKVDRLSFFFQRYYTTSSPIGPQIQAEYFLDLFTIFHNTRGSRLVEDTSHPVGAEHMLGALTWLMRCLTADLMRDMLRTMNSIFQEFPDESHADEELFLQVLNYTSAACLAIEHYIQVKTGRCEGDESGEQTRGLVISEYIRQALHDHIYQAIQELVGGYSPRKFAFEDASTELALATCFRKMATFFSYTTPLLEQFRLTNDDSDGDDSDELFDSVKEYYVPEHIDNHDFERYEDNDWYAGEYQLVDVQDVLLGPEHVTLDEVSIAVAAGGQSACDICGDSSSPMRKIRVCIHTFCEECLGSQLGVEHECRYKCPCCRAEFFPRSAA
jgi:hypothetical protein